MVQSWAPESRQHLCDLMCLALREDLGTGTWQLQAGVSLPVQFDVQGEGGAGLGIFSDPAIMDWVDLDMKLLEDPKISGGAFGLGLTTSESKHRT